MPKFNQGQLAAVAAMLEFIDSPEQFFILSGAAGTGKTFCIKHLVESTERKIIFTAPTNKATKVLRSTLTTDEYFPECRTTYSLLGLKLEADGAVKRLASPKDAVDLGKFDIVVIDESSMVNEKLWEELLRAADQRALKFIFMGDPNQLPPVGEARSQIWEHVENRAELTQVMRFDNQILVLAEKIKKQVDAFCPQITLAADNDEIEGVWYQTPAQFNQAIARAASLGDFSNTERMVKAIAWRNATVVSLNRAIRRRIFDNADEHTWLVGDRIILTGPVSNPLDGKPVGCTDDEGVIDSITVTPHPTQDGFLCYNILALTDENKRISLWVLHEQSKGIFDQQRKALSESAKANPCGWKVFWTFVESFHQIQHGYAITAHRAQGSTYDTAYVVWNDILLNRNRNEGFRCLYVAATRPKRKLILGSL